MEKLYAAKRNYKRGKVNMPVSFENRNFQKELDKKLELIKKEEKVPTLLLHRLLMHRAAVM